MQESTISARETDRVTLLFSGGIDSTLAAIKLAETHDRVVLVSYWNGFGHYHINRTRKRAAELSRHFPGKFAHSLISIRDLFEPLMHEAITVDYDKTGSGFVWCMSCKLAMHTRTVAYNLEHGIAKVADGSSGSTDEMVEQAPFSIELLRSFYREYGIAFATPVYDKPREESIQELKAMGFNLGFRLGDRFLGIQPKCKPGELYYLPFVLLGSQPEHREEVVVDFINEKLATCRQWLAAYCREHGIAMPKE